MKKKHAVLWILFLGICIWAMGTTYDSRVWSPFDTNFSLHHPFAVTKDAKGMIYVIDQSKTRIVIFSKDGTVQKVIRGGRKEQGTFFYASEVYVAEDGFIYVINVINSMERYAVDAEEILRYTPDGKYDKVIWTKEYLPEDSPARWGRLTGISVEGDRLYVYYIYPHGVDRLGIAMRDGVAEKEPVFSEAYSGIQIKYITPLHDQVFAYTTKNGEVYKVQGGQQSLLYNGYWKSTEVSSVPWHIAMLKDGTVFFSDLSTRNIYQTGPDNKITEYISGSDYEKLNLSPSKKAIKHIQGFDDGTGFVILGETVIYKEHHQFYTYRNNLRMNGMEIIQRIGFWSFAIGALVCLFILLRGIYKYQFNRRIPLMLKQILIYIPLVMGVLVFTSWYLQRDYAQRLEKEMEHKLNILMNFAPKQIDGDLVETLKDPQDYMNENYRTVRASLLEILKNNQEEWSAPFYILLQRKIDDWQYIMMDYDDSACIYWPYQYNTQTTYVEDVVAGKYLSTLEQDQEGMWLYGTAPLYNSKGQVVALVEIGADMYNYTYYNKQLMRRMIRVMSLLTLCTTLVIVMVSYFMIRALHNLTKGVQHIANGSWDTQVKIQTKDEIQDLGEGFNRMSEYIRDYLMKISEMNKTYFKFVPHQFMEYLGKENITEIKLGDQVQRNMSVMFTDIRSFTSNSETMTPKENFEFVNRFLSLASPEIRLHSGFIDKYIGDAIMALFPNPDDAVDAAIEMYRKTCVNKDSRLMIGREPIRIGIGIFTGPVILGIVGEEERMSSTVISDSVNIASRLESLTKMYHASIIISKSTLNLMKAPEKYKYRFLGYVQVVGKNEAVGLFEILNCYDEAILSLKLATKEAFESAIKAYHKGNYSQAEIWFDEVLEMDPEDKAAQMYIDMCRTALVDNDKAGRMFIMDKK